MTEEVTTNFTMSFKDALLAYQFNTLGDRERRRIEELLLDSPAVVMEFITIKRAVDGESESEPSSESNCGNGIRENAAEPSPLLHARLRRAFAEDWASARGIRLARPAGSRRFMAKLAVAAALVGLTALAAGLLESHRTAKPPLRAASPTGISVDGANRDPITLDIL